MNRQTAKKLLIFAVKILPAVQRFYNQQTKQFSKKPISELCEITKEYFEEIILMIAILRQNPTYWQKLLAKIKER